MNFLLDSAMFSALLVVMAPHFSGIAIHEWLSIAFGAAIVTHLLLHWSWLVEVTRRFFRTAQRSARINYVLNALLFVDMTIIIFTGLMISEAALPLFGVQTAHGGVWRQLHGLSADLSLVLVGLHLALHWHWIVGTLQRYVRRPRTLQRGLPVVEHAQAQVPEEVR